ncbi:alpha/beta hydrolase [Bacillus sp. sid0103]|nr:alpha/beta hydrolase [Bacillus sp. sid0103]
MKKTLIYKKDAHYKIKADFYQTKNLNNSPVVVYIHGGGLIWGSREDIDEEMISLYTNNGFSLFSIDYRLAPESKLSNILEDVQDALLWLESEGQNQFSIDPKKIGVVGGSAGGFLALFTGTFKYKPRAIVSFYGYGDISTTWAIHPSNFYCKKEMIPNSLAKMLVTDEIITEASIEKRYLIYLHARQQGVWVQEITGKDPVINKEEILKFCPLHNITTDFPPTLLLHGTKDTDVPYEQSVFMRAALIKKEVETKLITIPNGEHVFEKDFHNPIVQDAMSQVIHFLRQQLK